MSTHVVQDISSVFIFQANLCFYLKQIKSYFLPPLPLPPPGQHYLFLTIQVYLTIALQLFPSEELPQCWNIYKLSLKEDGFFKAMFQIQVQ